MLTLSLWSTHQPAPSCQPSRSPQFFPRYRCSLPPWSCYWVVPRCHLFPSPSREDWVPSPSSLTCISASWEAVGSGDFKLSFCRGSKPRSSPHEQMALSRWSLCALVFRCLSKGSDFLPHGSVVRMSNSNENETFKIVSDTQWSIKATMILWYYDTMSTF